MKDREMLDVRQRKGFWCTRHRRYGWDLEVGLSSLRQRVVHHGIAPAPAGRQHMQSIEAAGTARHRYDSRSCIEASRSRAGGSAWRASRQWALPDITTKLVAWHAPPGG